jgi:outer membrane murein-binding lipoprotein Lpp
MTKYKRRMMIAVAATALALAGCSDNTKRDHAACKLKAMEQYKTKLSSTEYEDEQAYYVQICMEAAGYQLWPLNCGNTTARWTLPS